MLSLSKSVSYSRHVDSSQTCIGRKEESPHVAPAGLSPTGDLQSKRLALPSIRRYPDLSKRDVDSTQPLREDFGICIASSLLRSHREQHLAARKILKIECIHDFLGWPPFPSHQQILPWKYNLHVPGAARMFCRCH